jgi:ArsR family metal-binding transcriptional regulator
MEFKIEKNKNYEIIVFANQDEDLNAQQILVKKGIEFKHISTITIVVPQEKRFHICELLNKEGILISGYYPFLYRNYEEEFFKKAQKYKLSTNKGEFLKSITLCYVAPCIAEPKKIRLIAYFSCDISEVMPYLNAVIKGASYNKNAHTLTYTKGRRVINLYNIKVALAKIDDIIDAWNILNEIKDLVNKTYQNKDKIKPNYEAGVKLTPMQIYDWLPKTNCKRCGEATCLAFAVKLLQGEQKLENCKPLFVDKKFEKSKLIMQEMTETLGL